MVDEVLELVGDARIVLLGEATHGTREFYELRAQITERLVAEHGFRGVAAEADWPAAARVNRYVQGAGEDPDARAALGDFRRFPQWMWRNPVVAGLVERLRDLDAGAGFYGLDLYSLRESMDAVISYLDDRDPEAAARARDRYACFDHYDDHGYGHAVARGRKDPCEDAVVAQLADLRGLAAELAAGAGDPARDAHFVAEQNARLAADAERYYRCVFRGRGSSWNLRDTHMADTLDALLDHLGAPVVVWAHNSHVGDARGSEMGWRRDELNLGQLARERHGDDVRIVGFTTASGTVTAAEDWNRPGTVHALRPPLPGSLEALLHERGTPDAVLDLRAGELAGRDLLQRFVGVVYRARGERAAHYLTTRPADQYDVLVHVDRTSALAALDAAPGREPVDLFPSGQ
jgi:erythromycin esterase-like protein